MRFNERLVTIVFLLPLLYIGGCASFLPTPMPLSPSGPIGIYHEVKVGETLSALSSRYSVPAGKIVDANNLSDPNGIEPGQLLYIPFKPRSSLLNMPDGYRKHRINNEKVRTESTSVRSGRQAFRSPAILLPAKSRAVFTSDSPVGSKGSPERSEGHFIWPITGSVITRFGIKKNDFVTKGVDIRALNGADVRAAGDGTITFAGAESNGKGKMVVVDHGAGVESIYAHNSEILVKVGERVNQSDIISRVYSTDEGGAFLHFEIRENGKPVDPLQYLN